MAKSNVKVLFSFLVCCLVIVLGGCAGGFFYLTKLVVDFYCDKSLELVKKKTEEEEGFCLTDIAKEYNLSYYNLQEFYKEACVSIIVSTDEAKWLGSGVCVASKGYKYNGQELEGGSYIVTNYHVIEEYYKANGEKSIDVYPNEYTNTERYGWTVPYSADVMWYDTYLDSAVLYIEENIDWVRMKDRSFDSNDLVEDHERAFVIGTPEDIKNQNTIATGYIANNELNYSYTVDTIGGGFSSETVLSNVYEYLIPINITIIGGNSGGGLFDDNGYLIGQPTLGREDGSVGINYAIPIYHITYILEDIIKSNEGKQELKKYSIDDIGIKTIDYYESQVMQEGRELQKFNQYFYGGMYSKQELIYNNTTGLKVLQESKCGLVKNDIIISITIGETTSELTCRNDLIFILLKCKEGDTIQLNLKDKNPITITLN